MAFVVEEKDGRVLALPSAELGKADFSETAMKILHSLAKKPSYPKEMAAQLRMHEQKVYYHVHNLEKQGIIRVLRKEERGGTLAKIYVLTKPSFFLKFRDFEKTEKIPKTANKFLEPFIAEGVFNAKIVVGSPDPHGPERARSRDASYAIDLALFLGTFLNKSEPSVVLDTELHEVKENLIIIGGPVINRITRAVNDKLPVRFDAKKNIYSSLTKKTYRSDECGIIVKADNPFNRKSKLLLIAGKRFSGTRAAVLALLKRFDEIQKKNAHVVLGLDSDYDGVVDDVRILE
ncbi:MAG: S-layer protein [Candidatus Aenigmarchaeota archaeon]|nr:S-layer protein [Candidatus Aenigmarchaeota archaeon]